ncbi:MAG TPA: ATP-binding protein [Kofleriaceae bacterium]|nr:ATP-binding protein [Kofleriaceae bacterium]
MFAPLKFRHRIGLLLVLTALGSIAVTAVTLVLLRRSERQLSGIETRYVPLIELDRDLDATFMQLIRAFEDAAAAADEARLADAERLHEQLARRIALDRNIIDDNGGDARVLAMQLRAYYDAARPVSEQLMAGTQIDQLAARIDQMRQTREKFAADLATATRPDRRRLAEAFARARTSQRRALRIDIAVAASVLALMALVSWRLIRRTVGSLRAVSEGVERLARGEFGQEIEVTSPDEIGDLAREANRTAERLREYRDRTESLLLETQHQATALARASDYKSAFLASMSHELRTPLNSIMILSNVLRENADGLLSTKHVEFATLINKCGTELLALINEVLDLAKIEAGKQSLACAPLRLEALEDYMRRMFEPTAAQRKLAFRVEAVEGRPDQIITDEPRVAQIVKNLLSNAFKFTEEGSVTVRVEKAEPGVAISVIDTGIGIAKDKVAWVFEAFTQAETGSSRKYGGTGLGLAIAKQLAVRLGGDLVADSELGKGSTFTLRLPLVAPSSADAIPEAAPVPTAKSEPVKPAPTPALVETTLAGATVLLVDDDMRNLYSLASVLRESSITVVTAADGSEALEALEREPHVDAVLMDVMMPVMDGHEAIRRIRAQDRFRALPIVALTARAMEGERERCLEAGATDYLPKPVDVARLFEVLRRSLTAA